jgi:hypothetical protein
MESFIITYQMVKSMNGVSGGDLSKVIGDPNSKAEKGSFK